MFNVIARAMIARLSLISTHTFRPSPAKFSALDKRKLVKPTELDGKYLLLCSHSKFKCFNFCEISLQRSQSDFFRKPRTPFMPIKKFLQNGRPGHSLIVPKRKQSSVIFSKQELSGFRLVSVCNSFHSTESGD